jgi:hypothetical protein
MKKLFTILTLMLSISICAQPPNTAKDDVKAHITVYLDGESVETDEVMVGFKDTAAMHLFAKVTNDFNTWLKPNKKYSMIIYHPGYSKHTINIATNNKPDSIHIRVILNKAGPRSTVGYYKYDPKANKYTHYD